MSGVETGRITIRRVISDETGETSDIVWTDFDGDAKHTLTALGMLALAHDTALHQYDEDGDDL